MRFLARLRVRLVETRLPRKYAAIQQAQAEAHRGLVSDLKVKKRQLGMEIADVILKLDAVSDTLESALEDMKDDD